MSVSVFFRLKSSKIQIERLIVFTDARSGEIKTFCDCRRLIKRLPGRTMRRHLKSITHRQKTLGSLKLAGTVRRTFLTYRRIRLGSTLATEPCLDLAWVKLRWCFRIRKIWIRPFCEVQFPFCLSYFLSLLIRIRIAFGKFHF